MKPLERKNYGSIPHLSNSKLGEGDYYVEKGMERILTEKKEISTILYLLMKSTMVQILA
jgi:hypothetical protein